MWGVWREHETSILQKDHLCLLSSKIDLHITFSLNVMVSDIVNKMTTSVIYVFRSVPCKIFVLFGTSLTIPMDIIATLLIGIL